MPGRPPPVPDRPTGRQGGTTARRAYTSVELTVTLALVALLSFGAARTLMATGTQASDSIDALALERQLRTAAVQLERDTAQVTSCAPDRHTGPARHLDQGRVELFSDVNGDGAGDLVVWTVDTGALVRHVEVGDGTCDPFTPAGDYDTLAQRPPGETIVSSFAGTFTFDDQPGVEPGDCDLGPGETLPAGCDVATITLTGTATGAAVSVPVDATWPIPTDLFTP